jgi:hypothetical protein
MPYRNGGFAPKNWVPRFPGWVPENSAVGSLNESRLLNCIYRVRQAKCQ